LINSDQLSETPTFNTDDSQDSDDRENREQVLFCGHFVTHGGSLFDELVQVPTKVAMKEVA
jgi:hypothetical protein